jgi:hypothetical protein
MAVHERLLRRQWLTLRVPRRHCSCTKSSTSCLPGKAIYSNGKCCSTCPKGFTQKGMECCSE